MANAQPGSEDLKSSKSASEANDWTYQIATNAKEYVQGRHNSQCELEVTGRNINIIFMFLFYYNIYTK